MIKKLIPNSIGIPLHQEEDCYLLDITFLRVFTGLSVIARTLGEQFLALVRSQLCKFPFLWSSY